MKLKLYVGLCAAFMGVGLEAAPKYKEKAALPKASKVVDNNVSKATSLVKKLFKKPITNADITKAAVNHDTKLKADLYDRSQNKSVQKASQRNAEASFDPSKNLGDYQNAERGAVDALNNKYDAVEARGRDVLIAGHNNMTQGTQESANALDKAKQGYNKAQQDLVDEHDAFLVAQRQRRLAETGEMDGEAGAARAKKAQREAVGTRLEADAKGVLAGSTKHLSKSLAKKDGFLRLSDKKLEPKDIESRVKTYMDKAQKDLSKYTKSLGKKTFGTSEITSESRALADMAKGSGVAGVMKATDALFGRRFDEVQLNATRAHLGLEASAHNLFELKNSLNDPNLTADERRAAHEALADAEKAHNELAEKDVAAHKTLAVHEKARELYTSKWEGVKRAFRPKPKPVEAPAEIVVE